jgi:hypothetical protein
VRRTSAASVGDLLLTATITPNASVGNLRVIDPAARKEQYLAGFRFALGAKTPTLRNIVFAENSGADLADFHELAAGRDDVEVLSVAPARTAGNPGRGYLELMLVAAAVQASRVLLKDRSRPMWKVTGRYRLRNLEAIVANARPGADLYLNLRRYPYAWADMWVYGATARGLELLTAKADELREDQGDQPAEISLYALVREWARSGERIEMRLPFEPRMSGIRGFDSASYSSMRQRAKWMARSAVRRAIPGLWI